ncbi:hypothetical protein B9Z35_05575 [Limnohabitans sp. Jir61]|uniref:anti-phage ZorAB system protein ZorA n=1 Tax=Limnohabitans sp. Jir61 TaxID=1826168 RepID=UPI000D393C00|nr:anti-phage ZorAB system protein ZorA [Limnohabitans sp. Jir61]PUE32993.1 hypothetical protein B9Z35_05575 [Limnohabitans sp. Jir61]
MSPTELAVFSVIAILVISFFVKFVAPSRAVQKSLREAVSRLEQTEPNSTPQKVSEIFSSDKTLLGLWKEFAKTLHEQRELRNGELQTTAVFSTVTADAYFNPETVFEGPINSEFFKHLPGVLTGCGIIGTFFGLIIGLHSFASIQLGNSQATQQGLQLLMDSVSGAFTVSTAAIISAMVITVIEKYLVKSLTADVQNLVQAIDQLYDAGASEDYLARLVKASEDSSAQTRVLKDALVQELGDLLRELTAAQIKASSENTGALGASIGQSIKDSLQGPMETVAEIVKGASGDQSATASKLLQEVMTSFSQKLSDLFGSQISDINRLNQETSVSIKEAMGEIQKLVSSLENSGQKAAEQMSEKMFVALEKMSAKQEAIDGQTAAFVNELKKIVTEGQAEAQQKMIETMSAMSEQITKLTGKMGEEQNAIHEKSQNREKEMSDRAQNIVSGMTDSVKSAVEEIAKASITMSDSVATLSRTTTSAIDRMNGGAELIANASQEFSEAGKSVSGVLNQSSSLVDRITSSSRSIENSTNALEESLRDYKLQRSSISEMLTEIRNTVELAKKEAGLTADVLSKLDKATSQLGQAELAAEAYLANVSKVLAESHESFTREMNNSVNTSNREFHNHLKTAVDLLATTIGDLEASLGSVIGKKG